MSFDSILAFAHGVPTGWLIIGGFALFAAFITVRSGSERVSTFVLALPAAALLYALVSEAAFLGSLVEGLEAPLAQALLFSALFAAMYVLISRIGLSYQGGAGQPLHAALSGVAAAAVLAVIWVQTPAFAAVWQFEPQISALFGGANSFWWLLGSYATLAFVRG